MSTAAILIIGNEILSGRTQDSNLAFAAKKLNAVGIRVAEARVIADIEDVIVATVNELRKKYTYVFTTGGIGPTHDDITTDSVAKAFGVEVSEHPEARRRLETHYSKTSTIVNAARLRMARIPHGADLVDNGVSGAPGFRLENVYVMAGVPDIMQAMLTGVLPTLQHGPAYISRSVAAYVPESLIAEGLRAIAARYPTIDVGSYPWQREKKWGTSLVARGTDKEKIDAAVDEIITLVKPFDSSPEVE